MDFKSLALIFLILLSPFCFSQVFNGGEGQEETERIECREEAMRCTYIAQNLTARTLASRIRQVLKPGDVLLPSEGYINVESLKVLSFWFFNEELRARFEALLPLIDVMESGSPSHLVQLTTEIYGLSEEGLSYIDATISHARSDTVGNPDFDIVNNAGVLDLSLNLSSKLLSAVLGAYKTKVNSTRLTRVVQLIPNLARIGYSRTTNIYISPTAGIVKEEQAGLTLGGSVSINAGDPNLVLLKDYSFKYGVVLRGEESDKERVNLLSISNPQLYLYNGLSTMIVSTQTTTTSAGENRGILQFGRDRNSTFSKLMVVTRAKGMTFEDYVQEMQRHREFELYRTFTEEQTQSLPATGSPLKEVLKSLQPYAYMTASGDRIVGFKIDKKLAARDIIKKDIEVKVIGGGLKMKKMRSIENLMLSGFKFDRFSVRYMDRPKVKVKIRFRPHGQGTWGRQGVHQTLYYDPERNTWLQ